MVYFIFILVSGCSLLWSVSRTISNTPYGFIYYFSDRQISRRPIDVQKYNNIGQFKDELRHGKGTYVLASGDTYTGDWVGGERHGKGTYAHVLGEWENDIYVGEFYKNKKQGRGLYTFPDGVKYLGSFYDDLRHGNGRFIYQDGSSMEVNCVKDSCTEK